jgi:hypothetical protein
LSYGGESTPPIPYNASPNLVASSLNEIPALNGHVQGAALVSGTSLPTGGVYEITLDSTRPTVLQVNEDTLGGGGYTIVKNSNIFVLPFHQSSSTVLSPLPTQALFFGSEYGQELNAFDIMPNSSPVLGQPVNFIFTGTTSHAIADRISRLRSRE